jgi:hypothetical protein
MVDELMAMDIGNDYEYDVENDLEDDWDNEQHV